MKKPLSCDTQGLMFQCCLPGGSLTNFSPCQRAGWFGASLVRLIRHQVSDVASGINEYLPRSSDVDFVLLLMQCQATSRLILLPLQNPLHSSYFCPLLPPLDCPRRVLLPSQRRMLDSLHAPPVATSAHRAIDRSVQRYDALPRHRRFRCCIILS